jgi:hypothetical protein
MHFTVYHTFSKLARDKPQGLRKFFKGDGGGKRGKNGAKKGK